MVQRLWLLLSVALSVLLADQVTKSLAVRHLETEKQAAELASLQLPAGQLSMRVTPNAELEGGVAQVVPRALARPLVLGAGLLALVFLVWFTLNAGLSTRLLVGLSALIGGAAGNLLDRVLHGHVLDWLLWQGASGHESGFTLADVGIWSGVGLLVLELVGAPRTGGLSEPAPNPPALPGV
jgi:signal peptidase II